MEFKEMKKEELIKLAEEQRHLAEAVSVKDNHIENLKTQLSNAEREIVNLRKELGIKQQEINKQQHLAEVIEQKDKIYNEMVALKDKIQKELNELQSKHKTEVGRANGNEEALKKLEVQHKKIVAIANGYIANFRSFLKQTQGGLEVAVELEALLSEQLKEK